MINKDQTENCRICNSHLSTDILSNLKTELGGVYSLKQCRICSFVSTSPLPSAGTLAQYYARNYWQRDNSKTAKLLTFFYSRRMSGIILNLKKLVPPKACILDWGAGDGAFQRLLERKGFDSYGIDSYSSESNPKKIIRASIEEAPFPEGFFDAITCFHVLEHIHHPVTSVKKVLRLLKPGGIFVVEVPNLNSVGFRIFKYRWQPLEIPTHLNHFTPATLQRVFQSAGKVTILKSEFFSHRVSPSALALSVFPALSPKRTRKKFHDRYPLPRLGIYLFMQLLAYPLALMGSRRCRGEIVRMFVRKTA
jgi:SAM-dependent methyltransferase